MSIAVAISYVAPVGNGQIRVGFNMTLSGNYVPGGDTINFATATQDPAFVGMVAAVEALGAPISMDVWDAGGGLQSGLFAVIGTNPTNCKMKVATAFNTEAGAVAYSGLGIVKPVGEAVFVKL
jgi:hypothetical protein